MVLVTSIIVFIINYKLIGSHRRGITTNERGGLSVQNDDVGDLYFLLCMNTVK